MNLHEAVALLLSQRAERVRDDAVVVQTEPHMCLPSTAATVNAAVNWQCGRVGVLSRNVLGRKARGGLWQTHGHRVERVGAVGNVDAAVALGGVACRAVSFWG